MGNLKRTLALSPLGDPEQGSRRCFADVTNRRYVTSATQAKLKMDAAGKNDKM